MQCRRIVLRAATLLVLAAPVQAQVVDQPRLEVGGGYSLMDRYYGAFPAGWFGSVGVSLPHGFAVVGEANAGYKTLSDSSYPALVTKVRAFSLLGGPRFSVSAFPKLLVFGQVLLGTTYTAATNTITGDHFDSYFFALQPGGGVDVQVFRNCAFRFEGNYQTTPTRVGGPPRTTQFAVGVVIRPQAIFRSN